MACWLMMHVLHRRGMASLFERRCVVVLVVDLLRASHDFAMQPRFAKVG
jgi:hypothetical protein